MCQLTTLLRPPHSGVGLSPLIVGPMGPFGPPCTCPQPVLLTALALVSRPASQAEAVARVPVTEATVETTAAVLAAGSKVAWEALYRAGRRWDPTSQKYVPGPRRPCLTRASCTQSRVLRKDREGAGHSAGSKPHPRMLFPPPPNQGATSDHRWRGLDRGPLACQPCLAQNPPGPPLCPASPVLTLLTGQAGPALWTGAVA